jgi:steroid delta-isomerase
LLLVLARTPLAAQDAAAEIRAALTQWTDDFNAGRSDKVCDLFAPDARADVRDAPERDHAAICELLVSSLNDKTRHYSYAKDIKEVLVFGEVAVVRLVWTLTIKEQDGSTVTSVEPGMDVFRKQPDGSWKIIRYMAYER